MNWPEKILDFILEWFVFLPLNLGQKSKNAIVRIFSFVAGALWVLPAFALAGIPIVSLILMDIFVEYVTEDL